MLEKIQIENYLSIKERQMLKVSNRLTTIIGENASGKTAILRAIDKLNGIPIELKEKNINLKDKETQIIANFCLNKERRKELNESYEKINSCSVLKYPEDNRDLCYQLIAEENGELSYNLFFKDNGEEFDFVESNKKLILDKILETIKSNENKKKIKKIYIDVQGDFLKFFNCEEINEISQEEKTEIDKIKQAVLYKKYDDLLPKYKFIYFNSFKGLLVDEININEIEGTPIVKNFFEIANIKISQLVNAILSNDMQYIKSVENKTVNVITDDFKKIFSQVKDDSDFQLSISINNANKKIYFWIKNSSTGSEVLKFSDESEGTQWYLSMYLRLFQYFNRNNVKNKYILLIDEPNVYLNAAAQKDLLENVFKKNLSDMQIIYTTHSPYMIDAEDLYSLRVIHKDNTTRIFNTTIEYLDYRKNTDKKKDVDVLSPVLLSVGINVSNQLLLDLKDNLIVLEGAQDYYILNAMKKHLKIDMNIKFIPCTGCGKVQFMCGYLVGLGYNVAALVDDDAEGRKNMKEMKKQNENGELYKVMCYKKNKSNKSDCLLEDLFSEKDLNENGLDKQGSQKITSNYRKIFNDYEDIKFDEETINNFKNLFEEINNCINNKE